MADDESVLVSPVPLRDERVVFGGSLVVPTGQPGPIGETGGTAFISSEPPEDPNIGWLWFNPDTRELRAWDGEEWQDATGASVTVGQGAPDNPQEGWLWYDGTRLSMWTAGAWVVLAGDPTIIIDPFPPANPRIGDPWLNPNTGVMNVWVGEWRMVVAGAETDVPLDMNGFPIDNLSAIPNLPNGAAPARWVLEQIASVNLYQGIWNAVNNVPDLSQASEEHNNFGWIAITAGPSGPGRVYRVPDTPLMPGLNGQDVWYADHIVWSSVQGRFNIIHSGNLSYSEAEDVFLRLDATNGPMKGPLLLYKNEGEMDPLEAAAVWWVQAAIAEVGAEGGGVIVSHNEPTAVTGQLWFNESNLSLSIKYGAVWIPISGAGGGGEASFARLVEPFTVPAIGQTVPIELEHAGWCAVGAPIFVGGMTGVVTNVVGDRVTLRRLAGPEYTPEPGPPPGPDLSTGYAPIMLGAVNGSPVLTGNPPTLFRVGDEVFLTYFGANRNSNTQNTVSLAWIPRGFQPSHNVAGGGQTPSGTAHIQRHTGGTNVFPDFPGTNSNPPAGSGESQARWTLRFSTQMSSGAVMAIQMHWKSEEPHHHHDREDEQ